MTLPNPPEVLIILFVILLVFGAGKLSAMGEALGKGLSGLQDSVGGDARAVKDAKRERAGPKQPSVF